MYEPVEVGDAQHDKATKDSLFGLITGGEEGPSDRACEVDHIGDPNSDQDNVSGQ